MCASYQVNQVTGKAGPVNVGEGKMPKTNLVAENAQQAGCRKKVAVGATKNKF